MCSTGITLSMLFAMEHQSFIILHFGACSTDSDGMGWFLRTPESRRRTVLVSLRPTHTGRVKGKYTINRRQPLQPSVLATPILLPVRASVPLWTDLVRVLTHPPAPTSKKKFTKTSVTFFTLFFVPLFLMPSFSRVPLLCSQSSSRRCQFKL